MLGAVWRSGCGGEDHSRVKHLCGQNKGLLLAYSYISKNTVNSEPGIELNTIFVPKQNLTFVNLQVFFFFCEDDVNKVLTRGKKKSEACPSTHVNVFSIFIASSRSGNVLEKQQVTHS